MSWTEVVFKHLQHRSPLPSPNQTVGKATQSKLPPAHKASPAFTFHCLLWGLLCSWIVFSSARRVQRALLRASIAFSFLGSLFKGSAQSIDCRTPGLNILASKSSGASLLFPTDSPAFSWKNHGLPSLSPSEVCLPLKRKLLICMIILMLQRKSSYQRARWSQKLPQSPNNFSRKKCFSVFRLP